MEPIEVVAVLSSGVTAGVCAMLVWHARYEDGLIGRTGLGVLGLCATLVLAQTLRYEADFNPSTIGMMAGMAVFLSRHAWRFLRFCRVDPESTETFKGST